MKRFMHSGARAATVFALGAALLFSLAAPAAAHPAAGHPARPMIGYTTGTDVLGPPAADCPAGSMWLVQENGTGYFTHLGRAHHSLRQCAAADMTTGKGWLTKNGSMTITAANGDRLTLSYSGTFTATPMPVPTSAVANLHWVVVGGTGRFARATGFGWTRLSAMYTADLTGATTSSVWWGWIRY